VTWRLGVAGSPIVHSRSPQLHEAGLAQAGLSGTSERVEIDLSDAVRLSELLPSTFDALSLTMPLKGVASRYCDEIDAVATRTGSVNSVVARGDRVLGASTDGQGFLDALADELGIKVEGQRVVVLGAGGAARAIIDALVHADVDRVDVVNRTTSKINEFSARYDIVGQRTSRPDSIDLIVNTVPIPGRTAVSTVVEGADSHTIAVDITYKPLMSEWRKLYEQAGCRTQNGLAMLAYQAALQMQWWWDVEIDGSKLLAVIS
jgi:shikimate dehydrogenase